jgi:hypothetical protein
MTGRTSPEEKAGGFGRMGTTLALGGGGGFDEIGRGELEGGLELRARGGGNFGAAIVRTDKHSPFLGK